MSPLILRDRISWFGGHTGYEQLTRYYANECDCVVLTPRAGQISRYLGSAYARLQGRVGRGSTELSELEFRFRRRFFRPDACHILYLEHHLSVLKAWRKAPRDVVGTIHLPRSTWDAGKSALLSRLASALVLYERDISFFEKYVGPGRVKFIHHGADTEFFSLEPSKLRIPPRILYGGVYLRNEPMLVRVVKRLSQTIPELRFDFLVPQHHRNSASLAPLLEYQTVTWHNGLNDEELRNLYQQAYVMLLPMNDSGANTAIVEALSSGLPIVTTDVGGIQNYGGGSIFPTVANNNDDEMISLTEQYLGDRRWRDHISVKCRRFAESDLAWPLVAKRHFDIYHELAQ